MLFLKKSINQFLATLIHDFKKEGDIFSLLTVMNLKSRQRF